MLWPPTVVPLIVHSDAPRLRAGEMLVAAIVNVRNPLEAGSEAAGDLFLADEPSPPHVWASGRFEDTVLCEVRHDRIEVVLVERVQHLAESLDLGFGFVAHEHLPRFATSMVSQTGASRCVNH